MLTKQYYGTLTLVISLLSFSYIVSDTMRIQALEINYYWHGPSTFPENTFANFWGLCPADQMITGGGYMVEKNIIVTASRPMDIEGNGGWEVQAYEPGADGVTNWMYVYTVCIK